MFVSRLNQPEMRVISSMIHEYQMNDFTFEVIWLDLEKKKTEIIYWVLRRTDTDLT